MVALTLILQRSFRYKFYLLVAIVYTLPILKSFSLRNRIECNIDLPIHCKVEMPDSRKSLRFQIHIHCNDTIGESMRRSLIYAYSPKKETLPRLINFRLKHRHQLMKFKTFNYIHCSRPFYLQFFLSVFYSKKKKKLLVYSSNSSRKQTCSCHSTRPRGKKNEKKNEKFFFFLFT